VDFQRTQSGRSSTVLAVVMAFIGFGAVLFLIARLGLLPAGLLGARPPGVVIPIGSTLTPTPVPRTPAPGATVAPPTATLIPTPSGPRPSITEPLGAWTKAWQEARYQDMYKMVSAAARQAIPEDKFVARYKGIMEGATVNKLEITAARVTEPDRTTTKVDVPFTVKMSTARLGDITEQNVLPIIWEENGWKVDWTPALIFKDLTADRRVEMVNADSKRGQIVDRNGAPLATTGKRATLGVVPGKLQNLDQVVGDLAQVSGLDAAAIKTKIQAAQPEWYVPIKDFPQEKKAELNAKFSKQPGVLLEDKSIRTYPLGESASNIIGFASPLVGDDLKQLSKKGYSEGDLVGRTGVEAGWEEQLAGVRGGRLSIVDQNGETVRVVAERQAEDGATVQLTIDLNIQKQVEAILPQRPSSMVIMDPRDNSVVAMATWPRFDPNGFILGFDDATWKRLNSDPNKPFQNRPTQSTYPTGSIFKPITMIAGLERGGFTAASRIHCAPAWQLPGSNIIMKNWETVDRGPMSLAMGITTSCNPVWYEVGFKLYNIDPEILPTFARQFGLGQPTGVGIDEVPGTVPTTEWKEKTYGQPLYPGDVVNLAIGQGYFQATPLQMANVYTTIARQGELKTPLLVKRLARPNKDPQEFTAQPKGRIQASANSWALLKEGMLGSTQNPLGTALYAMNGYRIPVASKTGSAENEGPDAHAWYGGYGPVDQPQVAIIAMVEGGQMGGVVAAPLARKAYEITLGK
jgi:penicillin-binding protein 2